MKRNERIYSFVNEIWSWYAVHKRVLPWRDLPDQDPTERAYKILVSEIMLQQTQVSRVIVTYRNFLERFPAISGLARASNKEVLMAWRGMGYNSRALRLRDAAGTIRSFGLRVAGCETEKISMRRCHSELAKNDNADVYGSHAHHDIGFPSSMEDLLALPGIGHYTAAAIRNFAFGIPTPCIDTNIRRILHRTFVGPESFDGSWSKDDRYLLKIAEEILEEAVQRGTTADWHAALMDFGSLVQTKRNPKWDVCPLTREGIMKTTRRSFELRVASCETPETRNSKPPTSRVQREPGRTVGSVFISNRIFRGRVIEALRDAPRGLTLHNIGKQIALDWDSAEHQAWLKSILTQLTRETMLGVRKGRYVLG